jgi:hypothetical protein
MKTLILVVLSLSILTAYGCSSTPLTIPTALQRGEYQELGPGEGSARGIMLGQLIPIGQNDRFVRAYNEAVRSKGGDALLNPVITEKWFWAYILNGYTTTVKGTVIKYKR